MCDVVFEKNEWMRERKKKTKGMKKKMIENNMTAQKKKNLICKETQVPLMFLLC